MAEHERDCVRARTRAHPLTLVTENALTTTAAGHWLTGVDAVIIGGSGAFSVHHPASRPWVTPLRHLLDDILTQGIPTFGICFGHQLIGQHLGREVITSEDQAERGTIEVQLTEEGARDPVYGDLPSTFHAHTGHTDLVCGVPEGARLLASTALVPTQAFGLRDAPVWSAQFHPDLLAADAMARYRAYRRAQGAEIAEDTSLYDPRGDVSGQLLHRFLAHVL